jgi:hypothetical protein
MLPELSVYSGATMKTAAAIALIVLILITGLPLALGMGAMEPCPSCPAPHAPIWFGACFAILAWGLIAIGLRSIRVAATVAVLKPLLLAISLERPPRPA